MHAGALSGAWDVVGRVSGREDLVNHVNDTVAGVHVSEGHIGAVNHHAITDGEGQGLTVDRLGCHAVGKGR